MFINGKKILTVVKVEGGGVTPSGTIDIKENGVHNVANYENANVDVKPTGTIVIQTNGTHDVSDVATAIVEVPQGNATLIDKVATENGTYNASDDGADGYSSFVVNVPTSEESGGDYNITQNILEDGTCELIITDANKGTLTLYNLTVSVDGMGWVNNMGTSQHEAGASVELKVDSSYVSSFVGWYEDDVLLSSDSTYNYTMPEKDTTITAKFNDTPTGPDIVA